MIIHNCTIITWGNPNKVIHDYALRIVDDRITEIEKEADLLQKYPNEEKLDARGQLLMPGLICAHTHFYSMFSRGMAIPGNAPSNFMEILNKLWWPLDQSLLEEDVYYSSMLSLVDAIKHGTTTIFDHHASPNFIHGSLDVIEKAVRETGIRASLCYEVTDRGGIKKADEGIEENVRMIKKHSNDQPGSLVTASFGLHAGLTLSDETLSKCRNAIPSRHGFHIHVAEDRADEFDSLNQHSLRVIDRLRKYDITGENSIFVHGVHLDDKEIELVKETHTWLTHQPRSNMNNAVGMADVESIVRTGVPVCIGNDGFSFAMWDEWRACFLAHKLWDRDPRSTGADLVIKMGAYHNGEMASHFFRDQIGQIVPGAKADLILVEYYPFTEMNEINLPWHILFGFRDSMVTMTMVNGKMLMKDRHLIDLDEASICREALKSSRDVHERYQKQFKD